MNGSNEWAAIDVPTQFVETADARLAYRMLGEGPALILCTRFRGTLDSWDPAFLDALAKRFRVVTFDYPGIGQSTGLASYNPRTLASSVAALADALHIDRFVLGGWSLGGLVAQVVAAISPDRVIHLALLGSRPIGKVNHSSEPLYSAHALDPQGDLDGDIILFFEPMSAESREAAKASRRRTAMRTEGRSPEVPKELYLRLLEESLSSDRGVEDAGYLRCMEKSSTRIVAISGDHDIGFPVENWLAVRREWRALFLFILPRAGNAAQHQYPEIAANIMASLLDRERNGDV